jgi:hypothetical protein
MGGMGEELAGEEYLRSGVEITFAEEVERAEDDAPWELREWLLELLTDAPGRPPEAGWGRGFPVFGGGGGGAAADEDFWSLDLDEDESWELFLLSCGGKG